MARKSSVKLSKAKAKTKVKSNPKTKTSKKKVLPIPAGYHSVIPYLFLNHAAKGIEFYKKVFNAKAVVCMSQPNGKIGHAELKIGDSKVMMSDECPEMNAKSPGRVGGTPVIIHLYVKKVDEVVKKAVSSGAKLIRPVEDMFYGDRSGMIEDPFGHLWCVSTHIEDVTPAKLKKRLAEMKKYSSKK